MIEQINKIGEVWWDWMWPMFWQVGLLVALIGVVDLFLRKRVWPQVRYALWLLVFVKLLLPPTLSLSTGAIPHLRVLVDQVRKGRAAASVPYRPPLFELYIVKDLPVMDLLDVPAGIAGAGGETFGLFDEAITSDMTELRSGASLSWRAYLLAVWLAGILILALWISVRFRRLRKAHSGKIDGGDLPQWFGQLLSDTAKMLNLKRLPEVCLSRNIASPAVFGVFRPVLLMPLENSRHLSREQFEHVLLHELAHIKRGDLKMHALFMLLQIVYWFNPLLWFVRRQLQYLRELCCDATVARILHERTSDYRRTILQTAKWLLAKPKMHGLGLVGLVEKPGRLLVRLSWLEKKTWKYRGLRTATVLAVVGLMFACVLPMAKAKQSAGGGGREKAEVFAFDDFDGRLGLNWDILHIDQSHYSLTGKPGTLTITTQNGHFKEANANYKNVFLINTPLSEDRDFQVTTCLSDFKPLEAYNQAGLICWDDEDNYLEWVYQQMKTRGLTFNAGVEANGPTRYTYIPAGGPFQKLWLRLTKRGSNYECSSSVDGKSFTVQTVQNWGDGSPKKIGLFAIKGSLTQPPDVDASFEFFEVAAVSSQTAEPKAALSASSAEAAVVSNRIPKENLKIPEELKPCAENLRTIYTALKKYEKEKGTMPDWLSDLVPDYLSAEMLIWPEDGPQSTPLAPDRHLPCSFGYQYSGSLSLPQGQMSYREFKDKERKVWGDAVPLVRYYIDQQCLNISFDGRIYMSSTAWETEIKPLEGAPEILVLEKVSVPASPLSAKKKEGAAKPQAVLKQPFKYRIPEENLNIPDELKACAERLRTFYSALKKYEKEKGTMPDWLSQLVPDYLDKDALLCPTHPSERPPLIPDPELPCSYGYQYSNIPLSESVSMTQRQWKDEQRRLCGDVVPMVRCYGHGQCLNLSFDGRIYISSLVWERDLDPEGGALRQSASPSQSGATESLTTPVQRGEGGVSFEKDLEAFFREMDTTYPFFDLKEIHGDWEQTKKELRRRVKECRSDEQFLEIATKAVMCLRDSHMWFRNAKAVLPQWPSKYYPGISFMPAAGGRVVIMTSREELNPNLKAGTIVKKIDGKDARRYLEDRARARWDEGGISGPQRARLFAYRIPLRSENKGHKHTVTVLVDAKEVEIELTSNVEARGWPHWYNRPENLKQVGSCSYTKLPSGVGYIYLRRIDGNTGPGMKEAFAACDDAKGWIIDLRGNGGGGYDQALYEALKALPNPLAVIIDAGCTSAGETMARDLVNRGNARLFGSKTAGSSSAKRIWNFPSGIASISVPTRSRWGIGGRQIEFNGIKPDVEVEAVPEEVAQGLNSAILRAEEYLAEMTVAGSR
jgi:beta-lactamase regulating signal transducer with metallopeptidase domain/regulation of enolase protein 1 (concanavalin A-like superfamily)